MFEASADFYDALYSFKDYNKESLTIRDYIRQRNPQAKSILDVACGTGKHMEALSCDYQVDGIDLNKAFVQIAGDRNPDSRVWCRDMTSFHLNAKYDVILCLFSSIAYVKTLERVAETVKQFRNHLKDNGCIMIEPWFTPEAWQAGYVSILNNEYKTFYITRMSHADRQGDISILNFEYLIGTSAGIQHKKERHELGLFHTEQLMRTFEAAGLTVQYDPIGISGRGLYLLGKNEGVHS